VFLDDNNQPINGSISAKNLEDEATQKALAQNGLQVSSVVVPEPSSQEGLSKNCKRFVRIMAEYE